MWRRLSGAPVAVVTLVVAGVVGGVAAFGDDSRDATGPYAVGTRSVTFVDDDRPTPAFGASPALPTRTVVTDLWYPAEGEPKAPAKAGAPAADGPFPVIVFNHGQQGEPQQYTPSFETWARAGYLVAAPRHPLTIRGGPGAQFISDVAGELGDVGFVITSIDEQLPELGDVDHVAVAGHSSGAVVAYGVGFNTCCHDERVDAVLVEALINVPLDGEYAGDLESTPVMFMHGESDLHALSAAHATFEAASPPKYFLPIPKGDHSNAYRTGPAAPLVAKAALAFFDLHLKNRNEALDTVEDLPGIEAEP
jgi:fermentation-respiration switch protein FrsA (DUF1100 family)